MKTRAAELYSFLSGSVNNVSMDSFSAPADHWLESTTTQSMTTQLRRQWAQALLLSDCAIAASPPLTLESSSRGKTMSSLTGYDYDSTHRQQLAMSEPPKAANNATLSMPRHSSGLTQLSDSYVEDPVPTRMMNFDEYYHRRKLYFHPGTISSPPNEGRRRTASPRIASPGYLMQQPSITSTGFDSLLLRRIPPTRTDDAATETAFSSESLSRATADSASIEARQTMLLSMGQARTTSRLPGSWPSSSAWADSSELMESSSPPPATFSTPPLLRLRRETSWSSSQSRQTPPHDGRTSRRSYQVTQVDTDDAIYRENSTTRMTPASRRSSHHMQRRRGFIAESGAAISEISEEPPVALLAESNGGRRRLLRRSSSSVGRSSQSTFRLPGEPQSAALREKCPGKPFHALSGDVETASTKRRRVDGNDAAEPRVARRLTFAGPEDPSSNAALRRTGSVANNPDRERKLQPTNAAGGARTTQKR